MLIAFSGAQSTGKTTMVKQVYDGLPDHIKDKTVLRIGESRQCPYPIDQETILQRQGWILARMLGILSEPHDGRLVLTDRTVVDNLGYTAWYAMLNETAFGDFTKHGFDLALDFPFLYDRIYLTKPDGRPIENDGVRDTNPDFRLWVYLEISKKWAKAMAKGKAKKIVHPIPLDWGPGYHIVYALTELMDQAFYVDDCVKYITTNWGQEGGGGS
jgi:hypothetical protein